MACAGCSLDLLVAHDQGVVHASVRFITTVTCSPEGFSRGALQHAAAGGRADAAGALADELQWPI